MRKEHTQQNIYSACKEEGSFIPLAKVDKGRIQAMVKVALMDLDTAGEWAKKAPKRSGQWNAIYKLHYDVLHGLAEAFVLFDRIKAKTHECLFAYLCGKHHELELDWNFFEKIRTSRNQSVYFGRPMAYGDWKEVEFQMNLYISTLKKAINLSFL